MERGSGKLFRSSRPDSIETIGQGPFRPPPEYCSGLLGRTPLRPTLAAQGSHTAASLFRSSRPDSIETRCRDATGRNWSPYCSGLLGRTPLRQGSLVEVGQVVRADCSGLLGRTPLRLVVHDDDAAQHAKLFRSSRPDSIETPSSKATGLRKGRIVPVF